MTDERYMLVNGRVELVYDSVFWRRWFNNSERHLARTDIADGIYVSTVFMGMNLNPTEDGPPLLWETIVFGGKLNKFRQRYESSEEACAGHVETCAKVRATLTEPANNNTG